MISNAVENSRNCCRKDLSTYTSINYDMFCKCKFFKDRAFYSLCMFITQYVIWVPMYQYNKPTNNLEHHILCAPLRIKGMGRWLGMVFFFVSCKGIIVAAWFI